MTRNPDLIAYLWPLARRYKIYLISLSAVAVSTAIFGIFVNYQIKEVIDTIASNPNAKIGWLVTLFTFYKLMSHGVYFISRLLDIKYKPMLLAEIVTYSYNKVMEHSLHWVDSHLSGEIASKITDLQDGLITIISYLRSTLAGFASILISIIFLLQINVISGSVIIVFIAIYAPILSILLKKQLSIQEKYVGARQEAVGIINDSIANVFGVKVIGNLWSELKLKLLPAVSKWSAWDKKSREYDAYYVDMTDTILATIMDGVQMWVLANLYKSGQITAGDFAFISMVMLNIHRELDALLENILFSINPKIAAIKSSYKFIYELSDTRDIKDAKTLTFVKGDIKYEGVSFKYDKGGEIFKDLTLHIKAGERVGIVGASGAGKTTLVKCLLRYFDVQYGKILIDGHDISSVSQESLRAAFFCDTTRYYHVSPNSP